jgi:hypothetical protein
MLGVPCVCLVLEVFILHGWLLLPIYHAWYGLPGLVTYKSHLAVAGTPVCNEFPVEQHSVEGKDLDQAVSYQSCMDIDFLPAIKTEFVEAGTCPHPALQGAQDGTLNCAGTAQGKPISPGLP